MNQPPTHNKIIIASPGKRMALQIAALNDKSFIFVIFTNPSAFPLWDLSRTGGAHYPLSMIALLELQSVEWTQRKPR